MTFSPEDSLALLAILAAVALLLIAAERTSIPYPILLVVGCLGLGFIPGIPDIQLPPDLVLIAVLPPLLYGAAFFTSLRDLRENAFAITLLAIGLVLSTMVIVAVVAHALIPGLSWGVAFVLGAVVSPTDPTAATAIAERVGLPRRLVALIEGESLVNDGTALVAYKFAVIAVVSGTFSFGEAAGSFALNVVGGIAIGLGVGFLVRQVRRRIKDPALAITLSLMSGYFAYLPAIAAGVSGVLAAVTIGVYMGWYTPELTTWQTRLQGIAVWEITFFILNALLFALIGLQLPVIVDALSGYSAMQLMGYAAAVALTVIAARFLWVIPGTYLTAWMRREKRPIQNPGSASIVLGWAGMRGAVSLAAALALPLTTDSGAPLPGRDLIQFITFALILVTVVGQGLTLPWLIRRLGVIEDGTEEEREELRARLVIARAALERVDELEGEDWTRDGTVERVRRLYEFRQRRFKIRAGKIEDEDGVEEGSLAYQRMMHEIYAAQRQALVGLRNSRQISSEVMRRVEHELDLEESRLEV
jgi:monovalent cation/hydrogen antiporter